MLFENLDWLPTNAVLRRHASHWLMLAVAAVAVSSLFALLLVAARAPGLGLLFPGVDFYRVALTLHVNLSQVVWFMAFASALWSMGHPRPASNIHRLALSLAVAGTAGVAISPLIGARVPLMSNYIPVLDHPAFLVGLGLFGLGTGLQALTVLFVPPRRLASEADAVRIGLWCAASIYLFALCVLGVTWLTLPEGVGGILHYELFFWGAGHIWQFCLALLMAVAWLGLARVAGIEVGLAPRWLALVFVVGMAPVLAAFWIHWVYPVDSPMFRHAYTQMMVWGSWIAVLPLGLRLIWRSFCVVPSRDPAASVARTVLRITVFMFVMGLLLGTAISTETTWVTAHYHGTVGAVTLSFMGLTYSLLPRLGYAEPREWMARGQTWFYGVGLMLMMAGLAWAGSFGAPRKGPGNVQLVGAGYEAVARVLMGIGGTLAVIGILLFLVIVYRGVRPRFTKSVLDLPSIKSV